MAQKITREIVEDMIKVLTDIKQELQESAGTPEAHSAHFNALLSTTEQAAIAAKAWLDSGVIVEEP